LLPIPEASPNAQLERNEHRLERTPIFAEHRCNAQYRNPQPEFTGPRRLAFPPLTNIGEKTRTSIACFRENLIAAITVEANSRRRYQHRWLMLQLAYSRYKFAGAIDAAFHDALLDISRPALGNGFAREVKDRVKPWDTFEARLFLPIPVMEGSTSVELRAPLPREVVDGVTAREKMIDQVSPDKSRRTRKEAVHRG
jgi:hypothetical protein